MTIQEAGKICERLVADYKDRLKVRDVKRYRREDFPQRIALRSECHLPTAKPEEVESRIRAVLEVLATKGDVVMVEPQYETMPCTETAHIKVDKDRKSVV